MDNKLKLNTLVIFNNYGLLYNWFAAVDASNIANTDWHLPSRAEYSTLTTYLGGESVAGAYVKIPGYTYWKSPNTGATNSAKFNVPGAGGRDYTGPFGTTFNVLKEICWFWTSTADSATGAWEMGCNYDDTFFGDGTNDKNNGYSIRLMKDTTSLNDGESGTYVGNDGKIYASICIGTQEWLASNLVETKYRDGTSIPEVIGNTEWAALSTGALCAYDNDWNYVAGYINLIIGENKLKLINSGSSGAKLLLNYVPVQPEPPSEQPLLIFVTNASTNVFDPVFNVT